MNHRSYFWGNGGITLLYDGVPQWYYPFPVSQNGPCDGLTGSNLRRRHEEIASAWVYSGAVPSGCAKAGVGPNSN